MQSFLLLTILCTSLLIWQSVEATSRTYGVDDHFDDKNKYEKFPDSPLLDDCEYIDWLGVNGFTGDRRKIEKDEFDEDKYNSARAFTVSDFPQNQRIQKMKIITRFYGIKDHAENDGLGFFWTENNDNNDGDDDDDRRRNALTPRKGGDDKTCAVDWFKTFQSFEGLENYGNYVTAEFSWEFTDFQIDDETFFEKVQRTGYFHFLIGEDTMVDFVTFEYTTSVEDLKNLVSFECHEYAQDQTVSEGSRPSSDKDTVKISTIRDSVQKSFKGASLVRTPSVDKDGLQSAFKMKIDGTTRFWVFVDSEEEKKHWLSQGGWSKSDGSCDVYDEQTRRSKKFDAYTKVYHGKRDVVFGHGCKNDKQPSEYMYFVAHKPEIQTQFQVKPNPTSSCRCQSTGDPHYITFDNARYDFYTPGTQHLLKARDCSLDIQTYTFKYGSRVTVNGILGIRYFNDIITLTRQPASQGRLWTGPPVVRVNRAQVGTSTSVGPIEVKKVSNDVWEIIIAEIGLVVKAQAAGNWYHIYLELADPDLQKRVDGLCGNCDGDITNDFKYPNCTTAYTSSKLSLEQATTWGAYWIASDEETFAVYDQLETSDGAALYAECQASPIELQCPDLVPPEPPTPEIEVSDPLPPERFVRCEGEDVVTTVDRNPPPVDIPEEPKLCTDRDDYQQIVDKCISCAETTGTPTDDCILDICETDIESYDCPEPPAEEECLQAEIQDSVVYGTAEYASLGDGSVDGNADPDFCDEKQWRLPAGWEVVTNDENSRNVIAAHKWEAFCMTTADGKTFKTAAVDPANTEDSCPTSGNLIKKSDGCLEANFCNTRILIRRFLEPECGNGIREEGEDCDDGNIFVGDGCDANCQEEDTHHCSGLTGLCSTVTNIVDEPEFHTCPYDVCSGCEINEDNEDLPWCCDCEVPCCI